MEKRCILLLLSVLLRTATAIPQQYSVSADDKSDVIIADHQGVQSEPVSIIFDNKPTIVNPGSSLSLDCGVSGDYRYCHWDNGRQPAIQVQDVYEGYIEGLSKPLETKGNECGIIINSVTTEDHGAWTCRVYVVGHTLQDTKNVTVTIKPTSPVLEVPSRPVIVNEGERQNLRCSVEAARPRVDIRWYLGDEDVTYNSKVENTLRDNMGTYKSISTLTQDFKAWHNRKTLRCMVAHYTLDLPIEDYVDITVRYKPWGRDVRLYGIRLGDDVEAKINFSTNPVPTNIRWGYGTSFEDIAADLPMPGEEGRYSTELVTLEDGHYSVILRVLAFDESDALVSFKVSVENELGRTDFRVTLSNDKPPNEPLSSGTLAAIVIVVLLIILFLLCAVYIRYNHLYCFADTKASKDDKEASATSTSDTESAQTPGCVDRNNKRASNILGKLQSGLRRNKSNENKAPKPDVKSDDNNKPEGLPESPELAKITDETPDQTVAA